MAECGRMGLLAAAEEVSGSSALELSMNLQTHIRSALWEAISKPYEAGNYSDAVLQAMHFLSELVREKAGGLDGDGAALVGAALGGNAPRLRLNRLQTETERNIQSGWQDILRGLYRAIRNPRSHERVEDAKGAADAIIYFIDYCLEILDQSREVFTIPSFLERVFDPNFVQTEQYAVLLVEEIPPSKRLDTLIELYRRKQPNKGKELRLVGRAILDRLPDNQVDEFLAVVSDELKVVQEEENIRLTLQLLPADHWPRISEVARIRVENMLIESIKEGQVLESGKMQVFYSAEGVPKSGAFGTWSISFIPYFTLVRQLGKVLDNKLADSYDHRRYVVGHFMNALPMVFTEPRQIQCCVHRIAEVVEEEMDDPNPDRRAYVKAIVVDFLYLRQDEWREQFLKAFADRTDPDHPEIYLEDGAPLFHLKEEDLPF